jgi:hypothetical protein
MLKQVVHVGPLWVLWIKGQRGKKEEGNLFASVYLMTVSVTLTIQQRIIQ